MNFNKVERFRIISGLFASKKGAHFGAFKIKFKSGLLKIDLHVVCAPDDEEWQHVSVSKKSGVPTWDEMCIVKNMFWDIEDTVIQFHPPKSKYVNIHNRCLHLWRNTITGHETPPKELI